MERTCLTCCQWLDHVTGMASVTGWNRWYRTAELVARPTYFADFDQLTQHDGPQHDGKLGSLAEGYVAQCGLGGHKYPVSRLA